MSEKNNPSTDKIREILFDAICKIQENGIMTLSDLYVSVGYDDLAFSVYDDDDGLLAQDNIDEWSILKDDPETMDEKIRETIKVALNDPIVKEKLESLDVIRPFSIVFVDEDFEQKEELLRLDDNIIVIEDDFLKNLDKELDDFLKNL